MTPLISQNENHILAFTHNNPIRQAFVLQAIEQFAGVMHRDDVREQVINHAETLPCEPAQWFQCATDYMKHSDEAAGRAIAVAAAQKAEIGSKIILSPSRKLITPNNEGDN